MCKCVQVMGEAECRELVVQTWQTENAGGMLTTDGTNRRRTPGGVFFWLVKQKVTPADRARLFPPRRQTQSKPANDAAAAQG